MRRIVASKDCRHHRRVPAIDSSPAEYSGTQMTRSYQDKGFIHGIFSRNSVNRSQLHHLRSVCACGKRRWSLPHHAADEPIKLNSVMSVSPEASSCLKMHKALTALRSTLSYWLLSKALVLLPRGRLFVTHSRIYKETTVDFQSSTAIERSSTKNCALMLIQIQWVLRIQSIALFPMQGVSFF